MASVRREEGIDIGKRMTEIGVNVAQQDTQSISRSQHHKEKVEKLTEVMDQLATTHEMPA